MSFFKAIGQFLLGDAAKPEAGTVSEPEKHSGDQSGNDVAPAVNDVKPKRDAVDLRQKIKEATLSLLDTLYLSDSSICGKRRLEVWIDTDTMTFNAYSDLEQGLQDYWSIERGYMFREVRLRQGKPDTDARRLDIPTDMMDIYIRETGEMPVITEVRKASVSIFDNRGSLLQEVYEISSDWFDNDEHKFCNIGRGLRPQISGAVVRRQNHIAIDDTNNLEFNKYVSRAHARIGFSKNIGFCFQVELGGSRLTGNRTRIFRGDQKIEIENVEVIEPLKDGDIIELGKSVLLIFREIK